MPRRAFLGVPSLGCRALAAPAWTGEPWLPVCLVDETPGDTDLSYGQPSAQEASVVRREHQEAGFSVWRSPLQHQRGIITASGLHFAVHHSGIPEIKVDRHALMIHGLVKKPLQFDLERLQRYPWSAASIFWSVQATPQPMPCHPSRWTRLWVKSRARCRARNGRGAFVVPAP